MGSMTAIVTGNVVTETTRIGSGDRQGIKFRMVATERYRQRQSGDWVDGKEFWVDVCCWGRLAEGAHDSIRKGDPVIVSGRLETDSFVVDGHTRSKTQLTATAMGHDLNWGTSRFRRSTRKDERPETTPAATAAGDDYEDPTEPPHELDNVQDELGETVGALAQEAAYSPPYALR